MGRLELSFNLRSLTLFHACFSGCSRVWTGLFGVENGCLLRGTCCAESLTRCRECFRQRTGFGSRKPLEMASLRNWGARKATPSHLQATSKPTASQPVATPMRPPSHPHACFMRPTCDPQASYKRRTEGGRLDLPARTPLRPEPVERPVAENAAGRAAWKSECRSPKPQSRKRNPLTCCCPGLEGVA